jgi:hypothetical protein
MQIALFILVAAILFTAITWIGKQSSIGNRLAKASKSMSSGDRSSMQALASEGLGDAALALVDEFDKIESVGEALKALSAASVATAWIVDRSGYARAEFDRRRFLGIGTEPDYEGLLREWGSYHFHGYGRELELAWIRTFGPEAARDYREAWQWLCLLDARWGTRSPPPLPSHSFQEINSFLITKLPESFRQEAIAEAKAISYREFVAGK